MQAENGGQEPAGLAQSPEFLALNPKHKAFVFAYLRLGNATRAYLEVYKCKIAVADTNGPKLLGHTRIKAALALADRQNAIVLEKEFNLSRKKRLAILARIATANLKNVIEMNSSGVAFRDEIDDDDFLTIKSISYSSSSGKGGDSQSLSIATHDRVKAIELMSRMAGDLDKDADSDRDKKPVDSTLQTRLRALRDKYSGQGNR